MPIELGTFDVIVGIDWLVESRKYIERGSQLFLAQVTETEPAKKQLQDMPVICNFPEVFPDDLPGLPSPRQVEFKIELIPGAAPVAQRIYMPEFFTLESSSVIREKEGRIFLHGILLETTELKRINIVEEDMVGTMETKLERMIEDLHTRMIQKLWLPLMERLLTSLDMLRKILRTFLGWLTLLATQSVFMNKECDLENTPVNDRYAKGMHTVPPPMIGNYMPSGPDVEIDYSKFTYGPKQISADELDSKPVEHASSDSDSSVETTTSMSAPVDNAPKIVYEPKVWIDAHIIEEYESDSDDDSVSNVQENIEKLSFTFTDYIKHVKSPRENVKEIGTPNHYPKIKNHDRHSHTRKGNKAHLVDYQEFKSGSVAFCGSNGKITGKGKIKAGRLDFEDVYYVEELKHYNLFFVSQMCDKKNKVLFTDTDCLVMSPNFKLLDENQVLLKIPIQHNMYSFNLKNIDPSGDLSYLFAKASIDESNKWNKRLSHVNVKNLNKLVKGNLVRGLTSKIFENDHTCVACQKGKQHKASCKFDGKSNLGVLVGYSLNSKAFRVYNLETKRVEENLYVNFLQNKPNIAGKGHACMFDLDYLTNSMNYEPVTLENQANKSAGPQEANNSTGTQADDDQVSAVGPSRALNDDEPSYPDDPSMPYLKEIYASPSAGIFIDSSYDDKAFASYMGLIVYQMDVESTFMYGTIDEEVYVTQPPGFVDPKFPNKVYKVVKALYGLHQAPRACMKTASTPIETQKPLVKDEEAADVDVHLYRYLKGQPKLGLWYPKVSSFNLEAYSDSDYAGANLDRNLQQEVVNFLAGDSFHGNAKSRLLWLLLLQRQNMLLLLTANPVFHSKTRHIEIRHHFIRDAYEKKLIHVLKIHTDDNVVDLLTKAFDVNRYALTASPTIRTPYIKQFWSTAKIKTVNDEVRVQALIDANMVHIKESSFRHTLKLDDEDGISCLANDEIFSGLANMGYEKIFEKLTFYKAFFSPQWKFLIHTILQCLSAKTTSWNKFSSTMASAIICLATNQKFSFSRHILFSLVKNIKAGVPFYMFLRFMQLMVDHQLGDMSHYQDIYDNPSLTKKVFANMKIVGTGFFGVITLLFENMLVPTTEEVGQAQDDVSILTEPSTSKPHKKHKSKKQQPKAPMVPSPESSPEHTIPSPFNDPIPDADKDNKIEKLKDKVHKLEEENRILKEKLFKSAKIDTAAPEETTEVEEVLEVVTAAKLMTKVVTTTESTTTATQVTKASAPRRRRGPGCTRGRAAVGALPVEVLELDTHLSSKADPSESSLPPVSVAPMVSPFLFSDDLESDTKIPERHVSPTPYESMLTRWRTEALTMRKSVRPLPSHRLALRYTSYHLDHFTFGSSSSHSSLDHSSSGHSITGHSLSGHTPPDTTDADLSTPLRFVHPSLAKTPRSGDSSSESFAGPSRKRCRSTAATLILSIHSTRALVPSRADLLLPCKRFRDSISPEHSVEEDIDTDVLEDVDADATTVEVVVDRDVEAGINAGIYMKVDVGVDVEDKVESSYRGIMEVGLDVVVGIDILDGMLMPDAVEHLEHVEEGL
nr:ribonuclease H-like domain-containing protein [Tanacetum cinerariifolium]